MRAGSRVRVRFAGRLVDGFVLERRADSEHEGRLAFIERAVGGEPVLTPETAALFRAVADRWAGNFVDVVPARRSRPARGGRDSRRPEPPSREPAGARRPAGCTVTGAGAAFLRARRGRTSRARAVWAALPGEDWPDRFAEAVAHGAGRGRGARRSSCPTPATSTGSTPR